MPRTEQSQPKSSQKKNQTVTEGEWCKLMFEWTSWIRKESFMLKYYARIDPYQFSIYEWARNVVELRWIRNEESKEQQE